MKLIERRRKGVYNLVFVLKLYALSGFWRFMIDKYRENVLDWKFDIYFFLYWCYVFMILKEIILNLELVSYEEREENMV